MNYSKIESILYECNCTQISLAKHNQLMKNKKRANKKELNKLIKINHPELYENLALQYENPYNCFRTDTHLILIHSAIEYFFRINRRGN